MKWVLAFGLLCCFLAGVLSSSWRMVAVVALGELGAFCVARGAAA